MNLIADPDLNVIALASAIAAGVVALRTTSRRRRAVRIRSQTRVWVESIRGAVTEELLRS